MTLDEPQPHSELDRMAEDAWWMFRILGEYTIGFDRLAHLHLPAVTVFGSARTEIKDRSYGQAEKLGRALAQAGFALITGGGPGVMQAPNKGAFEAGGVSVGLNVILPVEQKPNPYQTLNFEYFHARKVMLVKSAASFVVFPGGFGTPDEFGEVLTLVQPRKTHVLPISLVGELHWRGLVDWFTHPLVEGGASAPDNLHLFKVVDDVTIIPGDVRRSHDPGRPDGFKRSTAEDRQRARGEAT